MKKFLFSLLLIFTAASHASSLETLDSQYIKHWRRHSDIHEHLPVLRKLSKECNSVAEIGIRSIVSTWGVLKGLSENNSQIRKYIGIDIARPPRDKLRLARQLAQDNNIDFKFWRANDMEVELPKVDLLFIDSLHTYCHLTYELEKFSPKVLKYIALHDTSPPWSHQDDRTYKGDYSEYPAHISRRKRGLWPAVKDFLKNHPEWVLFERRTNNHGFTVLKRVKQSI